MNDEANDVDARAPMTKKIKRATGGAFGAGLVLIVLPSAALVLCIRQLELHSVVGLPILAIFGIMILFGALALISTVFARLSLSCATEALALPPGSIRAAIALALIVLFALISVMLYQSLSHSYTIEHLSDAQKTALIQEPANRVIGVFPEPCVPAAAPPATGASDPARTGQSCAPAEMSYTVRLRQSPGAEASDLAKQLLLLIGTLMTSVTSFYFASRATEAATKSMLAALATNVHPAGENGARVGSASGVEDSQSRVDGCDVDVVNATADVDLPPAKGGVER